MLLGKLLRVDVDQHGAQGQAGDPYVIPAGNPFAGRPDARGEVWAFGLRNPWRFSFDRATGDLWIADVGEDKWEEIDRQPAGSRGGENYGWGTMEGAHCFRPPDGCDTSGLVLPVAEYGHQLGCAIIGGYVYRGAAAPPLAGRYLYGDYCSGRIWSLEPQADGPPQSTELLKTELHIGSFGEDEAGEVYLTGLNTGAVYRLAVAH
jgi:glucose/arabinose dehydrogenase